MITLLNIKNQALNSIEIKQCDYLFGKFIVKRLTK